MCFDEYMHSMLSVLIPVYNFNIVSLVKEINRQAMDAGIPYEIMALDDGSDINCREQNRVISGWNGVRYEELPENIGRSRIRNKMASMASFPWLLFLDCDSQVVRNDYLAEYIQHAKGEGIVCGGRIYRNTRPETPEQYLRWKYGKKREEKPASVRNLKPWNSFMTNNFMASARVFERLIFDEGIERYGHEDTFFGIGLRRMNIPVLHIDNPLLHIGLESNAAFLAKTQEGIENLSLLMKMKKEYTGELMAMVKLLRHFSFLERTRTLRLFSCLFSGCKKMLVSNILSRHPSLLIFDLYKLGFFVGKNH